MKNQIFPTLFLSIFASLASFTLFACQNPPAQTSAPKKDDSNKPLDDQKEGGDTELSEEEAAAKAKEQADAEAKAKADAEAKAAENATGFKPFVLTATPTSGGGIILGTSGNCFGNTTQGVTLKIKVLEQPTDVGKSQRNVKFEKIAECSLTEGKILISDWTGWPQ